MHQAPTLASRIQLPRRLVGRRPAVNREYTFEFEIGQTVILECTQEAARVIGRIQMVDCADEYWIEILDATCAPCRVLAHQLIATH